MALTNVQITKAKPAEKAYKLADSGGLYLQITPAASKCWRMKYRYLGKEKLLSIGQVFYLIIACPQALTQ